MIGVGTGEDADTDADADADVGVDDDGSGRGEVYWSSLSFISRTCLRGYWLFEYVIT